MDGACEPQGLGAQVQGPRGAHDRSCTPIHRSSRRSVPQRRSQGTSGAVHTAVPSAVDTRAWPHTTLPLPRPRGCLGEPVTPVPTARPRGQHSTHPAEPGTAPRDHHVTGDRPAHWEGRAAVTWRGGEDAPGTQAPSSSVGDRQEQPPQAEARALRSGSRPEALGEGAGARRGGGGGVPITAWCQPPRRGSDTCPPEPLAGTRTHTSVLWDVPAPPQGGPQKAWTR